MCLEGVLNGTSCSMMRRLVLTQVQLQVLGLWVMSHGVVGLATRSPRPAPFPSQPALSPT